MWVVYKTKPAGGDEEAEDPGMGLSKAWGLFLLVSAGVIVSGYFLSVSADSIAEISGISSGTVGILLVSLVTTMPEASSTIAAARIGAMDLGVAGLYGSCAFNVTILFYADLFYRGGGLDGGVVDDVAVLVNRAEPVHFLSGAVAIALMLAGMTLIMSRNRIGAALARGGLALMAAVYIAAAIGVGYMGGTDSGSEEKAGAAPAAAPNRTREG